MNISGSTISFPFRVGARGAMVTVGNDDDIITQSIFDVLETRQGERVMLPTYGLPDVLFDVLDATFAARLAFFVETQIGNYIAAIESVAADAGNVYQDRFVPSAMPSTHTAAIRVRWTKRGFGVPQELIFPTWRLLEG